MFAFCAVCSDARTVHGSFQLSKQGDGPLPLQKLVNTPVASTSNQLLQLIRFT
jgi:hypothetical protein